MRRLLYITLCFCLLSAVALLPERAGAAQRDQQHAGTVYICPMHPDYVSDKPGSCPICGMDLVKKEIQQPSEKSSVNVERKIKFYRNPMDPAITSPVPAKDSMGMDYVPIYEEEASSAVTTTTFQINPEKQQLIGVRKGIVEKRDLVREVRATARVVIDQELYDAQTRYLGTDINVRTAYWNPAKQELLMLGMSEEEIEALRRRRWADNGILAYVPAGSKGFYRTVYPETAWVYAQVFEDEMHWIKPGNKVALTSTAFPGETFSGVVMGVAQTVDPATRTARVRIRLPDPGRKFHPEMFLTAAISADAGERLAVPQEAVIDSGKRTIVYVVKDGDAFEPRDVRIGIRANDFYEVLSGLSEGESVVVSGNFLLDSESRLQGVLGN